MTKRPWMGLVVSGVMLAIGISVGIVVTNALVNDTPPPTLARPSGPEFVSVTAQNYDDPRPVTLDILNPPDVELKAQATGTVTRFDCAVGVDWGSGSTNLALDGRSILNIHTSTPLWRPLTLGLKGPDVDAFKEELRRLGRSASEGTMFRREDLASFKALMTNIGTPVSTDEVSLTDVLWLPEPVVTVSKCETRLGDQVEAGKAISTLRSAPSLTIDGSSIPKDSPARVLRVGDLTLNMTSSTELTEPARTSEILSTSVYRSAAEQNQNLALPVRVSGTASLVEPIQVAALPPTSITTSDTSKGCVRVGSDEFRNVTIVSSQLGRSLVVFESSAMPTSVAVDGPPKCP